VRYSVGSAKPSGRYTASSNLQMRGFFRIGQSFARQVQPCPAGATFHSTYIRQGLFESYCAFFLAAPLFGLSEPSLRLGLLRTGAHL
jgi:hypothetical protein